MLGKRVQLLLLSLLFTVVSTSASAETLKLATWNIEHLRDGIREGPNPRTETDFERLASYAKTLRADVIAFQEAESLEAAFKVFNPAVYQIFLLGRKNWLFTDTPKGASANLYSLIETAKANGLEPYYYLRYAFTELPKTQTMEQIEALLPFNLDANTIRKSVDLRSGGIN